MTWRKGYTGEEMQLYQPKLNYKKPIQKNALGKVLPRNTRLTLEFYLVDPDDIIIPAKDTRGKQE
jgi:hypothetical protein